MEIAAGADKLESDDYSGVAAGDFLKLDPGTSVAEVVTMVKFGPTYLFGPTCFPHRAASKVRRLPGQELDGCHQHQALKLQALRGLGLLWIQAWMRGSRTTLAGRLASESTRSTGTAERGG